jgi:hypothetical protein
MNLLSGGLDTSWDPPCAGTKCRKRCSPPGRRALGRRPQRSPRAVAIAASAFTRGTKPLRWSPLAHRRPLRTSTEFILSEVEGLSTGDESR